MNLAETTLFASAFLVLYPYALYPLLISLAARVWGCDPELAAVDPVELPSLTLLIIAHDEEQMLSARLKNALALDYPAGKLEIVVASDGSRDGTADVVRGFACRGVRLLDYHVNRGKSATLNSAWKELTTEIVLLSDANTFIHRDAAKRLARWFAWRDVGAVCGRLVLTDPQTGNNVDGLYWKYETFLKRCEARLGALLGANGAIYAIRRETFIEIPAETIVDDFVIPLLARIKTGCRLLYDAEAVAHEETPPSIGDEFRRRVRIGAGGFQSLGALWPLLHPRHGWLAFSFWSHKVLRWFCPFFLLIALAANLLLLDRPFFQASMAAQAGFYAIAWLGGRLPLGGGFGRLVRLATMFSGMNAALLLGFFRFASGRQRGAWQRTARTA